MWSRSVSGTTTKMVEITWLIIDVGGYIRYKVFVMNLKPIIHSI